LRERREAAEAEGLTRFGGAEEAERTEEFRRIAREFPGSLREIEACTAAVLREKARAVEEEIARSSGGFAPGAASWWMAVVVDYHAALRECLAVKRWLSEHLARGAPVTPEDLRRFMAWHSDWPHRRGDLGTEAAGAFLERVRRPPSGRLHALVWRELQEKHGRGRKELELAVFGAPGPSA